MIMNSSIAIILSFAISLSARNIQEQPRDCEAPVPILVNGKWGSLITLAKSSSNPNLKVPAISPRGWRPRSGASRVDTSTGEENGLSSRAP
jgi:hypothetical protein